MATPDKGSSRDLTAQPDQPSATPLVEKSTSALEEYELGPVMSVSAEGELRVCTHLATGSHRVIKTMKKLDFEEREVKATLLRARIHSRLNHPHIVKIIEAFNTQKYLTLVYEFVDGGSLFDVLHQVKRYSEYEAARVMKQLLQVLAYLHESHIVHRDIKPENIMYNPKDGRITLISMHICVVQHPGKPLTSCRGTPSYMAPETIRECYDEKVDVWACGVVLYAMITGRLPFHAINDEEILVRVLKAKYELDTPEFDDVSPAAKQLVQVLLVADPAQRPSAAEAALHPWFEQPVSSKLMAVNPLKRVATTRRAQPVAHFVFKFFVENIVSASEKESLRGIFGEANVCASGALSKAELREALTHPGFRLSTSDAEHVFSLIEQMKRPITADEFVNAVLCRKKLITGTNIKRCFELLKRIKSSDSLRLGDLRQMIFPECDDGVWEEVKGVACKEDGDEVDLYECRKMLRELVANMP